MKKNILTLLSIIIAISISSCDFVTIPEQAGSTVDTTTVTVHRKVLLEDYTGHKCTACPAAAIVANSLLATNGENVIVVGVHAGFFATPATSGTQYLADFRTTESTSYDTYFGISNIGNPNGMINRKDFTTTTTTHVKAYGSWATEVAIELAKPALAKIEIANTYNSTTRVLNCSIDARFLYDTLTGGPYKLSLMVLQDSIVADQLDAGVYVPAYVHRHVLRANLNGTWGDNLVTGAIVANAVINKSYTYTLPATYPVAGGASATSCDASHCYIVAFIYNDATKEVIQVEEAKLIP
jgi:Outer membrane protein Omp28